MPTATFERLRPEKQARIVGAALAEFSARDFGSASLDRIAAAAAVPKGSLYQYFETKERLYADTTRWALDETWELFEAHVSASSPLDCWDLLAEAMIFMVELAEMRPNLASLYHRVVFSPDGPCREELHAHYATRSAVFHDRLLASGRESGAIDSNVDPVLLRFVLTATGQRFQQAVLRGPEFAGLPDAARDDPRSFARSIAASLKRAFGSPAPANSTWRTPPETAS